MTKTWDPIVRYLTSRTAWKEAINTSLFVIFFINIIYFKAIAFLRSQAAFFQSAASPSFLLPSAADPSAMDFSNLSVSKEQAKIYRDWFSFADSGLASLPFLLVRFEAISARSLRIFSPLWQMETAGSRVTTPLSSSPFPTCLDRTLNRWIGSEFVATEKSLLLFDGSCIFFCFVLISRTPSLMIVEWEDWAPGIIDWCRPELQVGEYGLFFLLSDRR